MCMIYFVGTDKDIPLIEFDLANPAFNVAELSEKQQIIREQFSKPYVHYVGSSHGCGCGFRAQPSCWFDSNSEDFIASVEDHNALADYLEQLVESDEEEIELYGCWSGDEGETIESREKCAIADIRRDDFEFQEREFLIITR